MARRLPLWLPFLTALACGIAAVGLRAESSQAARGRAEDTAHITLGQSLAPLYGPWKFKVGDSPVDPATHSVLWAQPGFDDSTWETVDLTPKNGSRGPIMGDPEYVPGWTVKGHAGYWGYTWYRMRVQLDAPPGAKLALAGPPDMDDAYEVFANGAMLGSFGDFTSRRPVTYYNQPMMFPLPQQDSSYPGSSTQVLAFRVWMEPSSLLAAADVGGFHTAPVLGAADAVAVNYQIRRLELFRSYAPFAVEALLYALLAVVAFSLILFDRSDRVYLWMGAVFLLTAAYSGLATIDVWTQHLSILTDSLLTEGFLGPLAYAGWVMVWWVWFGRQRPPWSPRAAAVLALLYIVSNIIAKELFFALIPHPVATAFGVVSVLLRLLFFALLLWIVIQGIRRQGLEGWLVLPAIVLLGIGPFQNELDAFHFPVAWFPFGVRVTLAQTANLLLAAVLALLLLRRLLLSVRRQRMIALDVKRAQLQSDFVAAVSHEFRSPLTTLRTITELLVQNRIPDDSRRHQSYVFLDHETTRLHRLVEDLLDFGRMESGRKQYRMETHDAFKLVRSTLAEFGEQAEAQGFRFEADLGSPGSPAPATIQVDEEAFRRALRNLLDNAMKYSPVCRTVWVDGLVQDHKVLISVRDQGMGIDADEEQAIFQKFVRGDAAKRAGIKGTGIGLAMVRQISESMGGEIRLQSKVGVGSTFTLVLPLADG
ncbi:MAG: HAMP domain-containing sensor histidine kinase [Terracidiphilus sp.]